MEKSNKSNKKEKTTVKNKIVVEKSKAKKEAATKTTTESSVLETKNAKQEKIEKLNTEIQELDKKIKGKNEAKRESQENLNEMQIELDKIEKELEALEKNETKGFSKDFIKAQIQDLLIEEDAKADTITIDISNGKLVVTMSGVEAKGNKVKKIEIILINNKTNDLIYKDYTTHDSYAMKMAVSALIGSKIKDAPAELKKNIEKIENKKVKKIWIEGGELKVEFIKDIKSSKIQEKKKKLKESKRVGLEEKKKLDAQLTTQNMDLLLLIQEKDNLENKLSDKEIEEMEKQLWAILAEVESNNELLKTFKNQRGELIKQIEEAEEKEKLEKDRETTQKSEGKSIQVTNTEKATEALKNLDEYQRGAIALYHRLESSGKLVYGNETTVSEADMRILVALLFHHYNLKNDASPFVNDDEVFNVLNANDYRMSAGSLGKGYGYSFYPMSSSFSDVRFESGFLADLKKTVQELENPTK